MKTSRKAPALHLVLVSIASLPLACKGGGCGGGNSGAAPSATASQSAAPSASVATTASASASASAAAPARGVQPPGIAGSLFRVTSKLELKPEQLSALDKIEEDLNAAAKAAREDAADGGVGANEMKAAQAELAAGVKAGKIDTAKMETHYQALEKAAKARQAREADALNRLHSALEPAQRTAAVANVRAMEERRAAAMKAHERPDAGRPSFVKMRLDRYTRELELDAEQQKKVEALLPKEDKSIAVREEMKKQTDLLLAAFEKDGFDAKKLDPNAAKRARAPMEDQAKLIAQMLPILRQDQRERFAKQLERGGQSGFARGHRGLGMPGRSTSPDWEGEEQQLP